MMHGEVILMAMAAGALIALLISWPFWLWRMDHLEKRTIDWVNEQFDRERDE